MMQERTSRILIAAAAGIAWAAAALRKKPEDK